MKCKFKFIKRQNDKCSPLIRRIPVMLSVIILLTFPGILCGQTPGLWTGAVSESWDNPANWDDGNVPDHTVDVVLSAGCPRYPTTDKQLVVGSTYLPGSIHRCKSLVIEQLTDLYVREGLLVYGNMTVSGLYYNDDHIVSGSHIIKNGGDVEITSTGSMFIGQYSGNPLTMKQDLIVESGGSLSNAGYLDIIDCLIIEGGANFTMTGNVAYIWGWEGTYTTAIPSSFYVGAGASGGVSGGSFYVQGHEQQGHYAININEPTFDFTGNSHFYFYNNSDQLAYPDFSAYFANGVSFYDATVENQGSVTTIYGNLQVDNDFWVSAPSGLTIDAGASVNISNDLTIGNNLPFAYSTLIDDGQLHVGGNTQYQWSVHGQNWHLVSSPITNATTSYYSGMYMQDFAESTNTWTDITSTTHPMKVMEGYAVWFPDPWWQGTWFTGTFNTGNVGSDNNLTKNNQGWNLIGNPYPSTIDWDASSGWTKTNVNNAIYLYDEGTWATYINGTGTNGGSSYIPPCHGFFVQVNTHPATLKMNNDVRVHESPDYMKNSVNNLVRLQVSDETKTKIDEAVVRIDESATSGFDGNFDAYKLYSFDTLFPQLFTSPDFLSINTIPETKPVQIYFTCQASGFYNLSASAINSFDELLLEDLTNGDIVDLMTNDYTFFHEPGYKNQRFVLHFNSVSVENLPEPQQPVISVLHDQDQIRIIINDFDFQEYSTDILQIEIYDVLGRLVQSTVTGTGNTFLIPFSQEGIFILRLHNNDTDISRKFSTR